MKKKVFALILCALMCITLFAACNDTTTNNNTPAAGNSNPPASSPATASRDADGNGRIDKVNFALPEDPVNLFPWDAKANSRKIFYAAIYDTLFDFIGGAYVPNIATGYTEIDELHWEVKIHDNVTDWNGNKLNAHDVVFCYNQYVDSGFAVKFNNFGGIEAKDDYTLVFTWNSPNTGVAGLDHVLCNVQLYCEKAWSDGFANKPVATGPYKLVEYVSGSKVVLEVNTKYWNSNPTAIRKQNADVIQYDVISESSQNVVGLKTGTLDISSNIPAENFAEFKADSKYNTVTEPANEIWVIYVNCSEGNPVSDVNLRLALFYAIDSESLAKVAPGNAATKAYGSPASPDYVKDWESMQTYYNTYDVAKAKSYLDASSYKGQTLKLLTNNTEVAKSISTMLQAFWEAIGVKTEIDAADGSTVSATSSQPDKWDVMMATAGGSFVVSSMNRLYNQGEFGGEYSNGFVKDDTLQGLFMKANNAATWGKDTLTDVFKHISDNGYHYVILYQTAAAVGSSAVTGFYFWDSVILPHCCTYKLA